MVAGASVGWGIACGERHARYGVQEDGDSVPVKIAGGIDCLLETDLERFWIYSEIENEIEALLELL